MKIGVRDRVTNIRTLWEREADFSDWLVTDEGMRLLAQDVGVEIDKP